MLKAIVADLNEVDETIRPYYAEKDGKFYLNVTPTDGWSLENVDGLKNALGAERRKASEFEAQIKAFEGIDPKKAADALKKVEKLTNFDPEKEADKIAEEKFRNKEQQLVARHQDAIIDATHMLGDEEGALSAVAVHSDTLKAMKKADLIDYIKPSDGGADIPVYMGKAVIVDDGMPVTTGTYTTYVFGPGAIGYGEKAPKTPVEADRNALVGGGYEYIVQRRQFVLHPRGMKWQGTPAKATPDNSELGTGTNWTRAVPEAKAVRIVKFVHKLAP